MLSYDFHMVLDDCLKLLYGICIVWQIGLEIYILAWFLEPDVSKSLFSYCFLRLVTGQDVGNMTTNVALGPHGPNGPSPMATNG